MSVRALMAGYDFREKKNRTLLIANNTINSINILGCKLRFCRLSTYGTAKKKSETIHQKRLSRNFIERMKLCNKLLII